MTMADFARRSIEAMIEHIVKVNPQILVEDFPADEPDHREEETNAQLDLFTPTD
jgi:hypothetical protein